MGYANHSSVFYRHYILETNATYQIQVIPILGNPALLHKISNVPVRPVSGDVNSWDNKVDNPGTA